MILRDFVRKFSLTSFLKFQLFVVIFQIQNSQGPSCLHLKRRQTSYQWNFVNGKLADSASWFGKNEAKHRFLYRKSFKVSLQGFVLPLCQISDCKYLVLLSGGAADDSGLVELGDLVLAVNGRSLVDVDYQTALLALRGTMTFRLYGKCWPDFALCLF